MNDDVEWYPPFTHPDTEQAYAIFNSLHVATAADYLRLTSSDRILYDVVRFEAEVMNGGVDQFLYNSSGDHALDTLDALDKIGATKAHEFLAAACGLFPNGAPSKDCETRREELEAVRPEGLDRTLDDAVCGEIESDLYARLFAHRRRIAEGGECEETSRV